MLLLKWFTRDSTRYSKYWVYCHRRLPGTGFLLILGTRCLNLTQIYYVLIPTLNPQTPILLVTRFPIPTLASTFLTIFVFCSGFCDLSPLSFLASLPQLQAAIIYKPFGQFILRDIKSFHHLVCVQFVSEGYRQGFWFPCFFFKLYFYIGYF